MNFLFTLLLILGIIPIAAILFFSRYSIAIVRGKSMEPTYFDGDIAILRRKINTYKQGMVLIALIDHEQTVIKRLHNIVDLGGRDLKGLYLWIEGDNKAHSVDSRNYGYIEAESVIGEVVHVWKRKSNKTS